MTETPNLAELPDPRRPRRNEPHIPLSALRAALGITVDTLRDRIEEECGERPSRAAISAIENGRRGLSGQMLARIELAYGLPEGSVRLDYEPRGPHNLHPAA